MLERGRELLQRIEELKERWGKPLVTRADLKEFSCGLIRNPKTIRNEDSKRKGIKGGFRVGRTVAYPVDAVIEYLISKLNVKE